MCKLLKLQVLTPRLEFVMHVLEQAVLLSCDLSRLVLAPVPVSLVLQLVRVQPRRSARSSSCASSTPAPAAAGGTSPASSAP